VTTAYGQHEAIITRGKHPNDLPKLRWINTMLSKLMFSFGRTFHAFNERFAGLRRRQVRQALPRGLVLPFQSPLLTGGDDREDRQGGQLVHAL